MAQTNFVMQLFKLAIVYQFKYRVSLKNGYSREKAVTIGYFD